jgi:predicted anti-sigma-YlaC factor YlaD
MTTCAECLSVLSTTRLSDIPQDSEMSAHVATCPTCSRLVTEMQYAERRLAQSLDSSIPITPPATVAASAMTASEIEQRKSIARWFRRGLAFAAAILFVVFLRSDAGRYMTGDDDFQRQTIVLKCISSESAIELATPYLRSNKGRIYRAGDLSMITVQGKAAEVNDALSQIERAERESPKCQLPLAPPEVTPSGGTPKKD